MSRSYVYKDPNSARSAQALRRKPGSGAELFIVTGPSGCGKSRLIRGATKRLVVHPLADCESGREAIRDALLAGEPCLRFAFSPKRHKRNNVLRQNEVWAGLEELLSADLLTFRIPRTTNLITVKPRLRVVIEVEGGVDITISRDLDRRRPQWIRLGQNCKNTPMENGAHDPTAGKK